MKKLISLAALFCCYSNAGAVVIVSDEIRNIDGDLDGYVDDLLISQIAFDVTAGTQLRIDSLVWEYTGVDLNGDGELTGFDNYMRLYSGTTRIASNDDAAHGSDGSVHSYDSQIHYLFGNAGSYMVTVGQLAYNDQSALAGYQANRPYTDYMQWTPYSSAVPADHGDWQLTFNVLSGSVSNVRVLNPAGVTTAVPEPASLALIGLGLAGIGFTRKTKKN